MPKIHMVAVYQNNPKNQGLIVPRGTFQGTKPRPISGWGFLLSTN